jgi:hypothetical protein
MHPSEWLSYPASEGVPNGAESTGLFVKGLSQEAAQPAQIQQARLPGASGTATTSGHYDWRNEEGQQQGCMMYENLVNRRMTSAPQSASYLAAIGPAGTVAVWIT